jgi:beta-mannosidase
MEGLMQSISLDGTWELRYGPQGANSPAGPAQLDRTDWPKIPAKVPGNVELDLLAAGALPDISVGNNIYKLRKFETCEWWYRRSFNTPKLAPGQRVEVVFEGLDCFGTVWINGKPAGTCDNMLIEHRFDIGELLRQDASNELALRIGSPVLEARKFQPAPGNWASRVSYEALFVRKAPHMYGWDIMPRAVSAGLWRGVALQIVEPTRWRSIYWTTLWANAERLSARLLLDYDLATDRADLSELKVKIKIEQDGKTLHAETRPVLATHGRALLDLQDVELWWPRGYGKPALCTATVRLVDSHDIALDEHRCRIGVRTIILRNTPLTRPEEPGEFVFVVNGEKIFVHGTNWVPLDALHSRDPLHLKPAVDMLVDLNCNMVRCWGGNVYEDHAFFDLCDENGIMVWQDFALACALYPQTDAFAEALRREAEFIVTKLRNHASLALWVGGNEDDVAHFWTGTGLDPDDCRLSRQVLPAAVRKLDPMRPYLPGSPWVSAEQMRLGAAEKLQPEQHLWGPRDDFKGPYYTQSTAHFIGEIGYHGCPDRRSLEQMMDARHVWPWQKNEQWLTKCVRPHPDFHDWDYRIPLMGKQTAILFGAVPEDFGDYVLASQISQAEAKKFFMEWARQGKWRRTGMLWWNLRDGWPIISDAIVDYYGRKKLAYEYLKRVQSDVCAMLGEAEDGQHQIAVVNDTRKPVSGTLKIADADSGAVLFSGGYSVEANGKTLVAAVPQAAKPAMWLIGWTVQDGRPGRNHYLAGPRPFDLKAYRRWLGKLDIPKDVGPER